MLFDDLYQEAQIEAAYLRGEPLEPLFIKFMESELKEFEERNNVGRAPQFDDAGPHPRQIADEPRTLGSISTQGS